MAILPGAETPFLLRSTDSSVESEQQEQKLSNERAVTAVLEGNAAEGSETKQEGTEVAACEKHMLLGACYLHGFMHAVEPKNVEWKSYTMI